MNRPHILIIAPHQDDEIIGCGGLICYAHNQGWSVSVVHVFAGTTGIAGVTPEDCRRQRETEAAQAAALGGYELLPNLGFPDRDRSRDAGIQDELIRVIRKTDPDIILLPHEQESDFEHKLVYTAGREATWLSTSDLRRDLGIPLSRPHKTLYYEVWKPTEKPALILAIDDFVDQKRQLLTAFTSQMDTSGWVEASLGRGYYRGTTLAGGGNVEVFGSEPLDLTGVIT